MGYLGRLLRQTPNGSYLTIVEDPFPFLQVVAYRYRHGTIAPRQQSVRSRTV
jgi:hypothetical protein